MLKDSKAIMFASEVLEPKAPKPVEEHRPFRAPNPQTLHPQSFPKATFDPKLSKPERALELSTLRKAWGVPALPASEAQNPKP